MPSIIAFAHNFVLNDDFNSSIFKKVEYLLISGFIQNLLPEEVLRGTIGVKIEY